LTNLLKPSVNIIEYISPLDWFVFIAILVLTFSAVVFGEYQKRKGPKLNKDDEAASFLDLLLMGRQLTLPLFVGTLVATWYGGIFGVTKIAFEKGIFNFVTQGAFWYIAYIIFALFIIDRIQGYEAVTLPDLIEKMFGPLSGKLSAVFNFFNVLPIAYIISLGLFSQLIFGGSLLLNMFGGVIVVLVYSSFGGFRAVVFSDFVQFFVMCIGVFFVLLFSFLKFGGLGFLTQNLPENHFSLTGGEGLLATFVWGFIALSTLVDPNFYQRCFAATSPQVAKKGIFISTVIWFGFDICTTFGAMYARATIPDSESGNAYLTYAIQILPDGIKGFVLAGILATILSTLDSYLFLAGTTVSYDLMPKKLKGKPWLHHVGTVSVGFLAIFLAYYFDGNIKTVWKTLGSYSASCLLLPVIYGHLFPRKIQDRQFVIACILGIVTTTYWRLASHSGFWVNIDELYIGILATSCGLLFFHPIRRVLVRVN